MRRLWHSTLRCDRPLACGQTRLTAGAGYDSVAALTGDLLLLVDNALRYNGDPAITGSNVSGFAIQLRERYRVAAKQVRCFFALRFFLIAIIFLLLDVRLYLGTARPPHSR